MMPSGVEAPRGSLAGETADGEASDPPGDPPGSGVDDVVGATTAPGASATTPKKKRRARRGRDFSSMYASVKGGANAPAPYVARTVSYAQCHRCGSKVEQAVDSIEAHEARCPRRVVPDADEEPPLEAQGFPRSKKTDDGDAEETAVDDEEDGRRHNSTPLVVDTGAMTMMMMPMLDGGVPATGGMTRSFSSCAPELLDPHDLVQRLSNEGLTVHRDLSGSMDADDDDDNDNDDDASFSSVRNKVEAFVDAAPPTKPPPAPLFESPELVGLPTTRRRRSSSHHPTTPNSNNISSAGWKRYSVAFGAGRMGLEFEYDAKFTRRLVVTSVSRGAAALGVRTRDVLIGIGRRAVPRGTDPLSVQRHLIQCSRPVTLHFYRLHVRRTSTVENEDVSLVDSIIPEGGFRDDDATDNGDDEGAVPPAQRPPRDGKPPPSGPTTTMMIQSSTTAVATATKTVVGAVWGATAFGASRLFDTFAAAPAAMTSTSGPKKKKPSSTATEKEAVIEPIMMAPLPRVSSLGAVPEIAMDVERYVDDEAPETLSAEELSERRCLVTPSQRRLLARALKPALRTRSWELLYDSSIDGMHLDCLYRRTDKRRGSKHHGPQLVLVRDDEGHVAGAFIDEPLRLVGDYYGTGECFVFELVHHHHHHHQQQQQQQQRPASRRRHDGDGDATSSKSEPAPRRTSRDESGESEEGDESDEGEHARIFCWVGPGGASMDVPSSATLSSSSDYSPPSETKKAAPVGRQDSADMASATRTIAGASFAEEHNDHLFDPPPPVPSLFNDMFIYATGEVLGFGSGGGGFALRFDEHLEYGASRPCDTYGNPTSLMAGREHFPIESVQVWSLVSQWS